MGNLNLYKCGIRFHVYRGDQTGKLRTRKIGVSLAMTVHTNTTHELYMSVAYFLLQVSVMHIDHHQIEYRYRRKTAIEEEPHFQIQSVKMRDILFRKQE
jgi:hypothetical protein